MTERDSLMIVDDEESVLKNLSAYYEDEGFLVHTYSCAEDALEALREIDPRIAIVDMRLPGMDGNGFIRKAHEMRPAMRFIIHTGSLDYTVPEDLVRMGVTRRHVVSKPVARFEDILKALE